MKKIAIALNHFQNGCKIPLLCLAFLFLFACSHQPSSLCDKEVPATFSSLSDERQAAEAALLSPSFSIERNAVCQPSVTLSVVYSFCEHKTIERVRCFCEKMRTRLLYKTSSNAFGKYCAVMRGEGYFWYFLCRMRI